MNMVNFNVNIENFPHKQFKQYLYKNKVNINDYN